MRLYLITKLSASAWAACILHKSALLVGPNDAPVPHERQPGFTHSSESQLYADVALIAGALSIQSLSELNVAVLPNLLFDKRPHADAAQNGGIPDQRANPLAGVAMIQNDHRLLDIQKLLQLREIVVDRRRFAVDIAVFVELRSADPAIGSTYLTDPKATAIAVAHDAQVTNFFLV
jgi:hypothetical protein